MPLARGKCKIADATRMVGERIRKARLAQGWSQKKLALRADVNWGHLSNIENGRQINVSVQWLFAIAYALNVSVYNLLPDLP